MTDPVIICENELRAELTYNLDHQIYPSENAIFDRLLGRRLELTEAYRDLHAKIGKHPHAVTIFLRTLADVAAFWNPEGIEKARAGRERLRKVNSLIAIRAAELSALLAGRSELRTHSGFADDSYYHIVQAIDAAGARNPLYGTYIKKPLRALKSQFDLKYWPPPSACVAAIGSDAERAELEATDPITAAATEGSRASLADFFKGWFEAIEENGTDEGGFIPSGVKLTDNSYASFANCVLDLGPEDLVDGAYVKRLRQRERERFESRRARESDCIGTRKSVRLRK